MLNFFFHKVVLVVQNMKLHQNILNQILSGFRNHVIHSEKNLQIDFGSLSQKRAEWFKAWIFGGEIVRPDKQISKETFKLVYRWMELESIKRNIERVPYGHFRQQQMDEKFLAKIRLQINQPFSTRP